VVYQLPADFLRWKSVDIFPNFSIMVPMEPFKPDKSSYGDHKTNPPPVPLPVERAITKLGNDLALARRRRHISQESLATRIGASLSTVKRMEKGDMRIPLHFIARALHVFGELERLTSLIDTAKDDIGLTLADAQLPQRVRRKTKHPPSGAL
jgi:ribosome-binding protein aMBF1 (putative translation factor)